MHTPLLADMGIPMILGQRILMAVALLPVIAIETFVVRRSMPLSTRQALGGVAAANALSTLIGVPFAWITAFAIELSLLYPLDSAAIRWHWQHSPLFDAVNLVLGAAWLAPLDRKSGWMVLVAAAVLLIPCFFVSVLIERWVCRRIWSQTDRTTVRHGVWRANLYSYAALLIFVCAWSAWEFHSTHS